MEALRTDLFEWGIATLALPDQRECGDMHAVWTRPVGALLAVVDGVGHGLEAAEAAKTAVSILQSCAADPVESIVARCHAGLRNTRGAAMSLVSLDAATSSIRWLSVGNVFGVLLRRAPDARPPRDYLVLRGGLVGVRLPPLHAETLPVSRGDLLVLATDGVVPSFAQEVNAGHATRRIAAEILARNARGTDEALVLVVRFGGGSS